MKPNRSLMLIAGILLGSAVLLSGPSSSWAQFAAAPPGTPGKPGNSDDGGSECDPATSDCGQHCCVRERKKVRVKVHGKWQVRTVLGAWRCFTGPEAVEKCRRLRRR